MHPIQLPYNHHGTYIVGKKEILFVLAAKSTRTAHQRVTFVSVLKLVHMNIYIFLTIYIYCIYIYHSVLYIIYTVKHVLAVTCIKRSPFSCPLIDNFIWIEPLLRGHLSYKVTFSWSQRWPLNTGLIVYYIYYAEALYWMRQFLFVIFLYTFEHKTGVK